MNGLYKFCLAFFLLSISIVVFLAGIVQIANQKYPRSITALTMSPTPFPLYPESGLDVGMLDGLKTVKKGIVNSATVSILYKGTITEIGKVLNQPGDNFKISIKGENGTKNSFTYSPISISKFDIYDTTVTPQKAISIEDLREGDTIEIENILDIFYTRKDMLLKGKISKID